MRIVQEKKLEPPDCVVHMPAGAQILGAVVRVEVVYVRALVDLDEADYEQRRFLVIEGGVPIRVAVDNVLRPLQCDSALVDVEYVGTVILEEHGRLRTHDVFEVVRRPLPDVSE